MGQRLIDHHPQVLEAALAMTPEMMRKVGGSWRVGGDGGGGAAAARPRAHCPPSCDGTLPSIAAQPPLIPCAFANQTAQEWADFGEYVAEIVAAVDRGLMSEAQAEEQLAPATLYQVPAALLFFVCFVVR